MKRIIGITAILITMAASISGSDPRPPAPSCGSVAFAQTKPECNDGALRGGQTGGGSWEDGHHEICVDGKWLPMQAGGDPSKVTCPKYQHVETIHPRLYVCTNDLIPWHETVCDGDHKECVDDIHFVTEKQWQDVLHMLADIQALFKIQGQLNEEMMPVIQDHILNSPAILTGQLPPHCIRNADGQITCLTEPKP